MALTLNMLIDSLSRYIFGRPVAVMTSEISPLEFFKDCTKLCSCDSLKELIETSLPLLKTLLSPKGRVAAFERTKSGRYIESATPHAHLRYLDHIELHGTFRTWSVVTLQRTDQLVFLKYFEQGSKVLMLPIFPEKKPRYEIIFVVGGVEEIPNTELLNLLHQQITVCFSRLYKHMKITDNREVLLTTLFKLCADLGGLEAVDMQIKIVNYLIEELSCETCCLLIAEEDTQHFVCQVVGSKSLKTEFFTSLRGGFFGVISRSKQARIMMQFTHTESIMLKKLFGVKVASLLCVPILSPSKEVVCLVCAANKSEGKRFSVSDVSDIETCLRYTWTLLSSSIALQKEKKAKNECQAMLQIAKNLFTHLDDVTILLGQIVQEARALTEAERCSVFLVNKESEELVAKVFDGIVTVDESLDPRQYDFEVKALHGLFYFESRV